MTRQIGPDQNAFRRKPNETKPDQNKFRRKSHEGVDLNIESVAGQWRIRSVFSGPAAGPEEMR